MMGKDEATVAAAAAILGGFKSNTLQAIVDAVDQAEKLVDELQKRGYVAYDGDDGVVHKFIVPPRSKDQL